MCLISLIFGLSINMIRHAPEVSDVMSSGCTDEEVNDVTTRHLGESELSIIECDSPISGLKEKQQRNWSNA